MVHFFQKAAAGVISEQGKRQSNHYKPSGRVEAEVSLGSSGSSGSGTGGVRRSRQVKRKVETTVKISATGEVLDVGGDREVHEHRISMPAALSEGEYGGGGHEGAVINAVVMPHRDSLKGGQESKLCKTNTNNLDELDLLNEYKLIKLLGSGTYGKVHLAEHKATRTVIALKVLQKCSTKLRDFQREFHFSYYLSPHPNIINTFDVAFQTCTAFVFVQEYGPYGDLFEAIPPHIGLPEETVKCVMRQVASALDWMHSKDLVHRDVKPENVMLFDDEFHKVKLIDFGMTRKEGTLVKKQGSSIPYTPYEICTALENEGYVVEKEADVWAFAVLLFSSMTGNFPWEKADVEDPYFKEVYDWQRRKTVKIPSQWRKFTPRLMRLFRKMLEPKIEKRCPIQEIHKYFDDRWVRRRQQSRFTSRTSKTSRTSRTSRTSKGGTSRNTEEMEDGGVDVRSGGGVDIDPHKLDIPAHPTYRVHATEEPEQHDKHSSRDQSPAQPRISTAAVIPVEHEAMNKLAIKLKSHGVTTCVDPEHKQQRVSEWILSLP